MAPLKKHATDLGYLEIHTVPTVRDLEQHPGRRGAAGAVSGEVERP
jgi:hypothetical protein